MVGIYRNWSSTLLLDLKTSLDISQIIGFFNNPIIEGFVSLSIYIKVKYACLTFCLSVPYINQQVDSEFFRKLWQTVRDARVDFRSYMEYTRSYLRY